ncbi:hypothetical protein [Shouchella hunanensis]|uniref:Uncharacterized protein n=1 Tax=Shouchella hunanensis TaxID=766894 RepID=A0ABY7WB94_9BACI|nr:hypothetical protein [Shouchella hunanensis]WDF05724.1 hypothetical protein PQ477_09905 [Shouchella hunanensis]
MKGFLFILCLCVTGCTIPADTGGDTLTSLNDEPFTGFVIDNTEHASLVSHESGLTLFSNIPVDHEVGDRVRIHYRDVLDSFPSQADGSQTTVVSPSKPEGATYSEKEAIQQALVLAREFTPSDPMIDYQFVTYTHYVEEADVWEITIQIYGEEEHLIEINSNGVSLEDCEHSSLTDYSPTCFTGFVTENRLISTENDLITFTNLIRSAEIGDRVFVEYTDVKESYPASADAIFSEIVSPPKPEGATYSEKEAIQQALLYYNEQNRQPESDPVSFPVIHFSTYHDETDTWVITINALDIEI